MLRFRKLSPTETAANPPTPSARTQISQAYDASLVGFMIGGYGRAACGRATRHGAPAIAGSSAAARPGAALPHRGGAGDTGGDTTSAYGGIGMRSSAFSRL